MYVKSRTKNYLETPTIQKLVEACFGRDTEVSAIQELEGGMFNALYIIQLAGNHPAGHSELVLKVGASPACYTLRYEKDIMASEVAVYKRLAGIGVPVPTVVQADFSHEHLDADYFFMEKLKGKIWEEWEPRLAEEDIKRLRFSLGCIVAQMHTLHGKCFGYEKQGSTLQYGSWGEALAGMVELTLEDGKTSNLALPYEEIRAAVKRHRALLDEIETPVLTSFDITSKNVLLHPVGGQVEIEGLIDHERAFYGDPYADFISLRSAVGEIEQAADFRDGYAHFTGRPFVFGPNHKKRHALYDLYMGLLLAAEQYRYDDPVRPHVVQYGLDRIHKNLALLA